MLTKFKEQTVFKAFRTPIREQIAKVDISHLDEGFGILHTDLWARACWTEGVDMPVPDPHLRSGHRSQLDLTEGDARGNCIQKNHGLTA